MKNIVITGSTKGIGLSLATAFLKSGCNVLISGRSEESFLKVENELLEYVDNLLFFKCDVTDPLQIENLVNYADSIWGCVDIWINNAGINIPYKEVYLTDHTCIDKTIDTNIKGVIYGSKSISTYMIKQNYGQIWNMEGLGSDGMIIPKTLIYGMSKRAVTYFTKGLSRELKKTNILVGRISPGMVLTDLISKSESATDKSFIKIFNILGDKPETIAPYIVKKILSNKKNDAVIKWLTTSKSIYRFMFSVFKKRDLL